MTRSLSLYQRQRLALYLICIVHLIAETAQAQPRRGMVLTRQETLDRLITRLYPELRQQGRHTEALQVADEAIANFPEQHELLLFRCQSLADLQRWSEALWCLQLFRSRVPRLSEKQQRIVDRIKDQSLAARTTVETPRAPLQVVLTSPREPSSVRDGHAEERSRRQRILRWSLPTACAGVAVLGIGLGLILGMVPRAHQNVEWQ